MVVLALVDCCRSGVPHGESFIVFFGGLIENSNFAKKHAEFSYYIIQSTLRAFLFEDWNAITKYVAFLEGMP
jgi:hypothetical protein